MTDTAIALDTRSRLKPARGRAKEIDVAAVSAANFKSRWLILVALILAAIMEVLDTTIINVALPQMAGNLSTTTQEIAWVSTGYILSNVVVLPMTAFLNARFGRRNYLTGSIVLFTVASLFCGLSHSLGEIVLWRVLQGVGGAALISTAQATLVQVFPPEEQSLVQPLFLMGLVVAPTLGPALGGGITDAASWHWCFFINVPVGIFAGALVYFFLHDTEPARTDQPADWAGIALLATGLASLQYVLEEGQQDDWFSSPTIVRLTALSIITMVALAVWQLSPRNTHPVIDFRVLRNRSLVAGMILFVAVGFGLYGVSYLYPLLAQTIQGLTAAQTGMALLPGGLATAFSIVFCGVVTSNPKSKIDARLLTLFGIGVSIVAMWFLAHLNPQVGAPDVFWPLLIRGLSIGFLFVPVNQLAIGSLKPDEVNQGTGLLGLARQLGGSFGIAILATFLSSHIQSDRAALAPHMSTHNPAFNDRLGGLTAMLTQHGLSAADAAGGALGMLDRIMSQQALSMAYNDTFLFLLLINLATAPSLLLLRRAKPGAAPAGMH